MWTAGYFVAEGIGYADATIQVVLVRAKPASGKGEAATCAGQHGAITARQKRDKDNVSHLVRRWIGLQW